MLFGNIFPLTGNWKYTCYDNHIFMPKYLKSKRLKKLGTHKIRIIRKKMKISVTYFVRKFVGRGGDYFHDDTILAAAFP